MEDVLSHSDNLSLSLSLSLSRARCLDMFCAVDRGRHP